MNLFQVFVNLMTNAIQAMDGKGTLTLTTLCQRETGDHLHHRYRTQAFPSENLKKIFEPFFSTKAAWERNRIGAS